MYNFVKIVFSLRDLSAADRTDAVAASVVPSASVEGSAVAAAVVAAGSAAVADASAAGTVEDPALAVAAESEMFQFLIFNFFLTLKIRGGMPWQWSR